MNHLWTNDFIKTVSNTPTVIVQPFYLDILENCSSKYKIAFAPLGDNAEISDLKEKNSAWEAAIKEEIDAILTFPTTYDFEDAKISLQNAYLLPPATITRRHDKTGRKID